jgi:hypothetical protein
MGGLTRFLLPLFLLGAPPLLSQDRDEELQKKVDGLCSKVGKLLDVEFRGKVPAAYQSREEFADFVRKSIEKEYPQEKIQGFTRLYQLLNLVPEDFDFVKVATNLMKSQAAAYYDPESKHMRVVMGGELTAEFLDGVLLHELVHALQDQEHDLDKAMKALSKGENDDKATAYRFLVEGEASFWMQVHMLEAMGQDFDQLPDMAKKLAFGIAKNTTTKTIINQMEVQAKAMGEKMPDLAEAAKSIKTCPPILVRSLVDPYMRGLYTAYRIHEEKGAEGFRKLFQEDPPACSRDMMFADEWLSSPRGVAEVQLADLPAALGSGWSSIYEDTLGAITWHTLFEGQKSAADAIAKGWDGDRVAVLKNGKDLLLAGVITFANPGAASKFTKQLDRQYREEWTKGKDIEEKSEGEAGTHLCAGTDSLAYQAKEETVVFARGVLSSGAEKVFEALWKSSVETAEPIHKP